MSKVKAKSQANGVKKHTGENCQLDLCTPMFQKVMATIFQDRDHFQHGDNFFG